MGTVIARLAPGTKGAPNRLTKAWLKSALKDNPNLEFVTVSSPVERGGRWFTLTEAWYADITFIELRQGSNLVAGIEVTSPANPPQPGKAGYKVH